MIERALYPVVFSEEWGRQMRFITGPRQSGKTTLAQEKLSHENSEKLYYLWDLRSVRERYKKNQLFFTEEGPPRQKKQWVCFDELHKIPKWKNALKAIYDSTYKNYQFIVTGSAKFEMFKKAGDSLAGRYFTFHLYPLTLFELKPGSKLERPAATAQEWIDRSLNQFVEKKDALNNLLELGGFPEPFLRQSRDFQVKWAADYLDVVIKEDIGALTRIIDRDHLFDLYHLLPEMVGNPLSEASLASHLEISQPTIKRHIKRLADFYLAFKISPYSKNIKRALLKASKAYLYDWTRLSSPGFRFENYVACDLLARIQLWKDAFSESFSLFFVKTKEREETDFLILKNQKPWLLIETKLTDGSVAGHQLKIQHQLGGIPLIQLCREENICKMEHKNVYRMSASRFLGVL